MSEKSKFIHLHVHSIYSYIDSLLRPKELFGKCEQLGMPAVAITDHYSLAGTYTYYQTSKEYNVKYISGIEGAYTADRSQLGVRTGIHHLVLLAKNHTGYQHLLKLNHEGYRAGKHLIFGRQIPVYDWDLLTKYHEGLICMSACAHGRIGYLLTREETDQPAIDEAKKFKDLFGDYYIELQAHNINDQRELNKRLIDIAGKADVPYVVTCDAHYLERGDSIYHDLLLSIQEKTTIDDPDRQMRSTEADLYIKSEQEVAEFADKTAIANTSKVAQLCEPAHWLDFKGWKMPTFDVSAEGMGEKEYQEFNQWLTTTKGVAE